MLRWKWAEKEWKRHRVLRGSQDCAFLFHTNFFCGQINFFFFCFFPFLNVFFKHFLNFSHDDLGAKYFRVEDESWRPFCYFFLIRQFRTTFKTRDQNLFCEIASNHPQLTLAEVCHHGNFHWCFLKKLALEDATLKRGAVRNAYISPKSTRFLWGFSLRDVKENARPTKKAKNASAGTETNLLLIRNFTFLLLNLIFVPIVMHYIFSILKTNKRRYLRWRFLHPAPQPRLSWSLVLWILPQTTSITKEFSLP